MALTTSEVLVTGESLTKTLTARTVTRFFQVRATTPDIPITVEAALSAPGLPVQLEFHPTLPSFVAVRHRARRLEGTDDLVEVAWEYEPLEFVPQDPEELDEIGHVAFNVTTESEFRDVWRVAPFEAGLNPNELGLTIPGLFVDIGGVPHDVEGIPQSYRFVKQTLAITEVVPFQPLFTTYAAAAGTRNSVNFYGAPPGFLVYTGGTQSSEIRQNVYRLTHTFVSDVWYHLKQTVQYDQEGEVVKGLASDHGLPNAPYRVAAAVWWRQPFFLSFNFDALSPYF